MDQDRGICLTRVFLFEPRDVMTKLFRLFFVNLDPIEVGLVFAFEQKMAALCQSPKYVRPPLYVMVRTLRYKAYHYR